MSGTLPGGGGYTRSVAVEKFTYNANGTIPTIRGPVTIAATNAPNRFDLSVVTPGNVTATLKLPTPGPGDPTALLNGKPVTGAVSNGWFMLDRLPSGRHTVRLTSAR